MDNLEKKYSNEIETSYQNEFRYKVLDYELFLEGLSENPNIRMNICKKDSPFI